MKKRKHKLTLSIEEDLYQSLKSEGPEFSASALMEQAIQNRQSLVFCKKQFLKYKKILEDKFKVKTKNL